MDSDSSLPRSSCLNHLRRSLWLITALGLLLLLVLQANTALAHHQNVLPLQQHYAAEVPSAAFASGNNAEIHSAGSPYEDVSFAYPYPLTTVVVVLLFIGMVAWLFYRSRSEGGRKTHMRRWAR